MGGCEKKRQIDVSRGKLSMDAAPNNPRCDECYVPSYSFSDETYFFLFICSEVPRFVGDVKNLKRSSKSCGAVEVSVVLLQWLNYVILWLF